MRPRFRSIRESRTRVTLTESQAGLQRFSEPQNLLMDIHELQDSHVQYFEDEFAETARAIIVEPNSDIWNLKFFFETKIRCLRFWESVKFIRQNDRLFYERI